MSAVSDTRAAAPKELHELVGAVRLAVRKRAGWRETSRLVAAELTRHLPTPEVLTAEQRSGDADGFRSHLLHAEPDGAFSIVALVWQPGQATEIHDHVTWCVFGVIQGVEHEELFTLDEERNCLREAGSNTNEVGEVQGFAPPGDIHRVRNVGEGTAISIHIYGTDVSRIGSSVRRYYDQHVRRERAPRPTRGSASRRITPFRTNGSSLTNSSAASRLVKIDIDPSCGSANVPTISSVPRAWNSSRRALWAGKWAGALERTSSTGS